MRWMVAIILCLPAIAACGRGGDCDSARATATTLLGPQLATERKVIARSEDNAKAAADWAAKLPDDQKEIGAAKAKSSADAVGVQRQRVELLEGWQKSLADGKPTAVTDDAGEPNASDGFRRVRRSMQTVAGACR